MTQYSNTGYLEKTKDGFEGEIIIDEVDISPISGTFFVYEKDLKQYLWLKRKPILEFNNKRKVYEMRAREPRWEAYLTKKLKGDVAYEGEFVFLHFKFKIVGIWDKSEWGKKKQRINFYVERLPHNQQTIINSINKRKSDVQRK